MSVEGYEHIKNIAAPIVAGVVFAAGIASFAPSAMAATIVASSCTQSAVSSAISSAASGDTVEVPGNCSASWSSLTIPSSVGITLAGGYGGGATTITSAEAVVIDSNATTGSRVTGFTFTASGNDSYGDIYVSGSKSSAPYRIDDNTFTTSGTAVFVVVSGNGTGLIDHNSFTSSGASEDIHNLAMGPSDPSGWTDDITPGSPDMVYVETNTFTDTGTTVFCSAIEAYYGSRTVFRYNTLNYCQVDEHGTAGMIGARWWEFYDNTFDPEGLNQSNYAQLRGGSGVFFDNHVSGTNTHGGAGGEIEPWEENTGYPADPYQPGRGLAVDPSGNTAQGSYYSPIYFWGNDSDMDLVSGSSNVVEGRDYFNSTTEPSSMFLCESAADVVGSTPVAIGSGSSGSCAHTYEYAPFTYPYPLTAAGLPNPTGGSTGSSGSTSGTTTPAPAITSSLAVSAIAGNSFSYTIAGSNSPTSYGASGLPAGLVINNVSGVISGSPSTAGTYSVTISATNGTGTGTATLMITVASTADTTPPSVPTNLTASAQSTSQIALSWTASTDNVGVAGYYIYRNGTKVAQTSNTSYTDSGLSAGTAYSYSVAAYDAAGNTSANSASVSATTQAAASSGSTGSSGGTSSGTTIAGISSTRMVDWTQAGIPGGIPDANWPVYETLSPSGGTDDSVMIQDAINAAPAGSVIVLNPGTYKIDRSSKVCPGKTDDYATGVYEAGLCLTDKSVVLRGAGPNETIIDYSGGASGISMGETYISASQMKMVPITSSATQGSTQITVQSASGITTGSYIVVTQLNPTDTDGNPLVNASGYDGCSYCNNGNPNYAMTQVARVTAVSGDTLTLQEPLYYTYNDSPSIYALPMIQNVGLEDLRLDATGASGEATEYKNINMEACAYCWVYNVESDNAVDQADMYLSNTYGADIENNYFDHGYDHDSGESYMVFLEFMDSSDLVQNNIIQDGRHATPLSGGSGNVIAYNYEFDDYMGEYPNSLPETQSHGAEPFMNLYEGNVTPDVDLDFAHGGGNDQTLFRNYVNLTDTDPQTSAPMTGGIIAMNIAYYQNYMNVVGNVLGEYGSTCTAGTYETDSPTSKVNGVIYQTGYYDDGGGSSPNSTLSAKVAQTLIRGGNWDCKTNSVVWNSNVPSGGGSASTYLSQQTLPASLYLTAEPSWYSTSGAVWPAINTAASTMVNLIPAQICYDSGPGSGNAFNPAGCYGSVYTTSSGSGGSGGGSGSTVTVPSVPTGLRVTGTTASTVSLAWSPSVAGTYGISGYTVYRNGTKIGTSASDSYTDTGLSPSTPYTYAVSAYDSQGNTSGEAAAVSATTQASTQSTGSAPSITSSLSVNATVGSSFSYQIAASNYPTSYAATGLISGLAVNTATGLISGTPTGPVGTYNITLNALNSFGMGAATLQISVGAASTSTTPSTPTSTSSSPLITSITPGSGPIDEAITITGSGFGTTSTVLFNGLVADTSVETNSASSLSLTVPPDLLPNCASGSACSQLVELTQAGTYQVSVMTDGATSNSMQFTITTGVAGSGGGSGGTGSGSTPTSTTPTSTTPSEPTTPPASTSTPPSPYHISRYLRRGVSGDDVKWLQEWLAAKGYYPQDIVTGYYGPLTEAAVQNYQARNGIVSSGTPDTTGYGCVGPLTRASIDAQEGD